MNRLRYWPLLLLLLLLNIPPAAAASLPCRLELRLDPDRHLLAGIATLQLAAAPRSFETYLHEEAQVDAVLRGIDTLSHRFEQGLLTVNLPPGVYGRAIELTIRYRLHLPDALPPTTYSHEDQGYDINAALGPQGAFLGSGIPWFPQPQSGRLALDLRLDLPGDWEAVTGGSLTERRRENGRHLVRWQLQPNRPGMALAAGPWQFGRGDAGPTPVLTYFSAANQALAEPYRRAAAGYLEDYSRLLGPYPFAKFAIVENFFPSGYGYPSWTLLGGDVIRLPFILDTSLPHEIVHNWLGNGVLVDYGGGNWSEGLTTYLADYRQREKESAEAALDYRHKILRDFASLVHKEEGYPLQRFQSRVSAMDQAIGYGKAMMVFHMLRQQIGDSAFFAGLKTLVRTRMHRETDWRDLQAIFEQTGRQPLGEFFDQWLQRPGAPELALAEVRSEPEAGGWRVQGVIRQHAPHYQLQVPLQLVTAGKTETMTVALDGAEAPFRLHTAQPPQRLELDADHHLFRQLSPSEVPPTVSGVRGSQRLLVVLSADLDQELLNRAQLLLPALRQELAAVASEHELTPAHLLDRDVLFIGLPRQRALLPSLPAPLALVKGGFQLAEQSYTRPDDTLFAALPHPAGAERLMALYLPGTPASAEVTARKIPHYGRYSYLAFRNGINQLKGTWPVTAGPLAHLFPPPDPSR